MPSKIKCISNIEIWPPNSILYLSEGMYKTLPGCIFGLSIKRIANELKAGRVVAI